jgi:hypothetical protein
LRRGLMRQLDLAWKVHLGPSSFPPPKVTFAAAIHDTDKYHFHLRSTPQNMSRASQITLATTCLGAIGIVAAVHWGQKIEKAVCILLTPFAEFIDLMTFSGNARRSHPRLRTTAIEARTPSRLRDATRIGGAVPKSADCL